MKNILAIATAVAAMMVGSASAAQGTAASNPSASVHAPNLQGHATKAELSLTFKALQFQRGALMIAIFDSEAAYMADGPAIRQMKLDVASDTVAVVVPGLVPGRYGIKLFHDLNGTGKLVTNMFGIPTVPVAFSNNAKINMRAPNWAEASFDLPASGTAQTIDIN